MFKKISKKNFKPLHFVILILVSFIIIKVWGFIRFGLKESIEIITPGSVIINYTFQLIYFRNNIDIYLSYFS